MGRKAFKLMPSVMVGLILSFFFLSKDLIAQDFQVTGTVKDKLDQPVAGVTVLELGTSNVSTTDAEGKFSITVGKTATLQFIAMSYRTVDIPVNGRNVINVVLEDDVMALDQVVVTALGIQRQSKEIGYATAKVSSEDLNSSQNLDATQALAGKVSGLQIQVNSASLDSEVRVNLRGNRSFKGNNQALLVVDGVPTPLDYLQTMNPNDIENITVLKGGSAAALYGSAAANGVLYVTTKKGNIGKPRITYSLTTTFDKLAYFPEYQTRFGSGAENSVTGFPYYIAYENQQYGPEFDGSIVPIGAPIYDPGNPEGKQLEGVYAYREGARESFYDTGVGLQNDISFQSGGEDGSLFLSYQHADKSGIIPGDKYKRQTVRFSASRKYKNLRASVNASYSNTNTNMNNSTTNGMQALWNTPAHIYLGDYKDWRNVEGGDPDSWVNSYYLNPSAQVDLYRRESRRDRIQGSAQLDYKPLPWLSFQGRAGLVMGVTNKNSKDYAWHYSEFAKNSGRSYALSDYYTALTTSANYYNRVSLDAMAFAEHEFSKKFKIKGMVGWSLQDTYSEYKEVSADRIQVDNLFNVGSKIGELGGENEYTQSRKLAVYGSIDFSLFGWAYIQVTGRNDWTSLLSPDNWSFFYPGVNASVMLSDAIPSLRNNWLSYLKLRGNIAKVGTVNIGEYNLDDLVNVNGSFPFGTLTSYQLSYNIRNRNIKPEFTTEYEAGFELGLLKDRIVLEAAYYHQTTTNQTVNVSIPYTTGFSTRYINAGTMKGQGVELDLKLTPLFEIGDFRWNVNANFTWNESKVAELYGGLDELTIYAPIYAVLGENYPIIKATDFKRDPQGRVIVNPTTGLPSAGDLVPCGTTEPKIRMGLSSNMKWRGFTLSATFDYRTGHVVRFGSEYEMLFTGASLVSAVSGRQRFVFPNSVIEVNDGQGNISYVPNDNITVNSGGKTFWTGIYRQNRAASIVSAAAWRLQELSLSYDFPERWMHKTKILQGASLSLVGRNLFLWVPDTNVWGDPGFSNSGNSNAPGLSENRSGGARTFGFNVTLTF